MTQTHFNPPERSWGETPPERRSESNNEAGESDLVVLIVPIEIESRTVRILYDRVKAAEALLREALDCVDADEQARSESWPKEVEKGDLTLDLGDRIRAYLEVGSHAGS
jgi:hypothetical protein